MWLHFSTPRIVQERTCRLCDTNFMQSIYFEGIQFFFWPIRFPNIHSNGSPSHDCRLYIEYDSLSFTNTCQNFLDFVLPVQRIIIVVSRFVSYCVIHPHGGGFCGCGLPQCWLPYNLFTQTVHHFTNIFQYVVTDIVFLFFR